jgi:AcrR family transcriptional regulator
VKSEHDAISGFEVAGSLLLNEGNRGLRVVEDEETFRRYRPESKLGTKGRRTRKALLDAAYSVFAENGYGGATVAAIAECAGVSVGTFYQYFSDRSEIMAALVRQAVEESFLSEDIRWSVSDGRIGLNALLYRFVCYYAKHARLWQVWEEVIHVDDILATLRRELGELLTGGLARSIAKAQSKGFARTDMEPDTMAKALAAMADQYCYLMFAFDPPVPRPSIEDVSATLASLWASALELKDC